MNELTMGQRIASRRKLQNLSQEALAEQLDVSRQAVSKWESDAAIPEIDKLIALSRLYGVSVGWLLGVEEPENSAAEALSETQLKMVEEIANRYRKALSGKRFLWIFALVLTGLLAIFFAFNRMNVQNVSIPDYSHEIAALEANYHDLQAQLDSMDALLRRQTEAGKLLRSYVPLCSLNDDWETVDITFYFFPKVYHENLTAHLSIFNPSTQYSERTECSWVGDRYQVHVTLPLADHYYYSFLLVSDTGYEEEALEQHTYFADLLTHSAFHIVEDHPQYTQMLAAQTAPIGADTSVYCYDAPLYMPRILENNGFVPFRDVKIELLHNDTVIWAQDFSGNFLELYRQDNIVTPLNPEIQTNLPQLSEGDRLILQLTATTHTGRTMVSRLDDLTVSVP